MLMPLGTTRRHLQGAIMGQVIGRHGWTWKTAQIACNPMVYKTHTFVCVLDVSSRQGVR